VVFQRLIQVDFVAIGKIGQAIGFAAHLLKRLNQIQVLCISNICQVYFYSF
jgi:hypothetical protein